jgi:hypothetical protein
MAESDALGPLIVDVLSYRRMLLSRQSRLRYLGLATLIVLVALCSACLYYGRPIIAPTDPPPDTSFHTSTQVREQIDLYNALRQLHSLYHRAPVDVAMHQFLESRPVIAMTALLLLFVTEIAIYIAATPLPPLDLAAFIARSQISSYEADESHSSQLSRSLLSTGLINAIIADERFSRIDDRYSEIWKGVSFEPPRNFDNGPEYHLKHARMTATPEFLYLVASTAARRWSWRQRLNRLLDSARTHKPAGAAEAHEAAKSPLNPTYIAAGLLLFSGLGFCQFYVIHKVDDVHTEQTETKSRTDEALSKVAQAWCAPHECQSRQPAPEPSVITDKLIERNYYEKTVVPAQASTSQSTPQQVGPTASNQEFDPKVVVNVPSNPVSQNETNSSATCSYSEVLLQFTADNAKTTQDANIGKEKYHFLLIWSRPKHWPAQTAGFHAATIDPPKDYLPNVWASRKPLYNATLNADVWIDWVSPKTVLRARGLVIHIKPRPYPKPTDGCLIS